MLGSLGVHCRGCCSRHRHLLFVLLLLLLLLLLLIVVNVGGRMGGCALVAVVVRCSQFAESFFLESTFVEKVLLNSC